MKAHKGRKQPILLSSDCSGNCGNCGQFFGVKVSYKFFGIIEIVILDQINSNLIQDTTNRSTQGKRQTSSARIVKTVREEDCHFKLEESISEIFRRMRAVSAKVLSIMDPHPMYI